MFMTKKTKLIIFLSFLLNSQILFACDFCNGMMGINPYYNYSDKIMLNILFQHSILNATSSGTASAMEKQYFSEFNPRIEGIKSIKHDVTGEKSSDEHKINFEFAYQHHFNSNWMVTAVVPIEKTSSNLEGDEIGLSDISILGHFIYHPDFGLEDSPITLLIGAGIKIPTGNYDRKHDDGDRMEIDHQIGSGSVDYILNGSCFYQLKDFTIGADLYGKMNSKNKYDEKLGNWFSASGTVSYDAYRNDEDLIGLIAIGGLRYEYKGENTTENSITDKLSDFASVFGNIGFQVIYQEIKLNVSALVPINQNKSKTLPTEQTRILLGTRWEF